MMNDVFLSNIIGTVCHCAKCFNLNAIMLNVFLLGVVMANVIMLNVNMKSLIMFSFNYSE
jgi:hypothetical protein